MGIGGDSPSSCKEGDLATTLGATLTMDRNTKHEEIIRRTVSLFKAQHVCFFPLNFMNRRRYALFNGCILMFITL